MKVQNNVEKLYQTSTTPNQFISGYFDYLSKLMRELDVDSVAQFVEEIETARAAGSTIFIAGNGGSAATASHMANDIAIGATKAGKDQPPFRVVSLCDNNAVLTAVGNDFGYDEIFSSQLRTLYRGGDKLIVISASGNSPNLIKAAECVRSMNGKVIGLLGFDGGALLPLCQTAIHVKTPKGEYGPVEDLHMIIDHVTYSLLRYRAVLPKEMNRAPELSV